MSVNALQMCGVLEDSAPSAINSFFGAKSASSTLANNLHQFETLCEGVVQALQPQQNGTASAVKEEAADVTPKEASAPSQDPGPEAANANGEASAAKPDVMEVDG